MSLHSYPLNSFSLKVQGKVLELPTEREVTDFFDKYGPSARKCYRKASKFLLPRYQRALKSTINRFQWDRFLSVLQGAPLDSLFCGGEGYDASDTIILVVPQQRNPFQHKCLITTDTVMQMIQKSRESEVRRHVYQNRRDATAMPDSEPQFLPGASTSDTPAQRQTDITLPSHCLK